MEDAGLDDRLRPNRVDRVRQPLQAVADDDADIADAASHPPAVRPALRTLQLHRSSDRPRRGARVVVVMRADRASAFECAAAGSWSEQVFGVTGATGEIGDGLAAASLTVERSSGWSSAMPLERRRCPGSRWSSSEATATKTECTKHSRGCRRCFSARPKKPKVGLRNNGPLWTQPSRPVSSGLSISRSSALALRPRSPLRGITTTLSNTSVPVAFRSRSHGRACTRTSCRGSADRTALFVGRQVTDALRLSCATTWPTSSERPRPAGARGCYVHADRAGNIHTRRDRRSSYAADGATRDVENETLEQAYASRAAYGAPAWEVESWVTTYTAIAAGEWDVVTDDVRRVAGHDPVSVQQFLESLN